MISAVGALVPIVFVVMVGAFIRRSALLDDHQLRGFEKLAFYVFFPAVIIHSIVSVDLSTVADIRLPAVLAGALVIMIVSLFLARRFLSNALSLEPASYTSVFQGSVRWNFFIGLAITEAYVGPAGQAYLAMAVIAMVCLVNIACVTVLARYASAEQPSAPVFAWTLVTNPLIWSSVVGVAINLSGLTIPAPVFGGLEILGRGALVGGLIAVGAGLELNQLKRPALSAWITAALKLIVMPLLVAGLAALAGLEGPALQVAIIAGAVPAATASYVLARQMGGDAPLMAQILTLQSLLAIIVLPAMFLLLT